MYAYPPRAKLTELQSCHEQYLELRGIWQRIDDLITGGHKIESKKTQYVVRRPDESPELYALRLKKFVYTPVLGDAIKEYTTKITNAPFNVYGVELDVWNTFRGCTDGARRDERELLNRIFRHLIAYGRAWVFIDKPAVTNAPVNRLQEEQLGLIPYVVQYSPLEVINWSVNSREAVEFVKVQQISLETNPFGAAKHIGTWTIIDDTHVARYQAEVKLNELGEIVDVIKSSSTKYPSNVELNLPRGYETSAEVPLISLVAHNRGACPAVFMPLDTELWSGNAAYLKALQHLNIENAWTDTATIAGYIQRVFKPSQPKPDTDPNFTYIDESADLERIKSGNQHLLIGDDFKFAEASGSSLQTISQYVLDKIETQIKAIVSMGNVSAAQHTTGKGVAEQSGASKQMDYTQINDTMRRYGSILTSYYEDILKHVARALGLTNLEEIKVSGLDTFEVDSLGNILEKSTTIQKLESHLPPTAKKLWWSKVMESMHSTVDAQTKETMRQEIEQMDFETPPPDMSLGVTKNPTVPRTP